MGEGREVKRVSVGQPTYRSPYRQFFTELPDFQGRSTVNCNLCKKDCSRNNFSRHMKEQHLPEEQSEVCGKEIAAIDTGKHRRLCGGLEKVPSSDMSLTTDSVNLTHVEQNTEVAMSSGEEDEIKITELVIKKENMESEEQSTKIIQLDEQQVKITLRFGMTKVISTS